MWVFRLILRNAGRHKLRTLLTVLGLAVATLAFVVIRTLIKTYYVGAELLPPDRLVTRNAVSITFTLPLGYMERIENVEGVKSVAYGNWFGGLYKNDPKNFFPNFAVGPGDAYLDMYSEFILPADQKREYLAQKNGAVAGQQLAERFGWKIGDIIPLTGQIYPGQWDLELKGIYHGEQAGVDESSLIFRWDYFDERMKATIPEMTGEVGWFIIRIAEPSRAPEISAAIDDIFKNSRAETLTETEKAFSLNFLAQMDTIIIGLRIMSYLIIGVILMVLVNTMAMSARERMTEYAVLKTLGFRSYHLVGLILGESLAIAALGGGLGILLVFPALNGIGEALKGFFPSFVFEPLTFFLAAVFLILVGFTAAFFPAYRAVKSSIIEGLHNIG